MSFFTKLSNSTQLTARRLNPSPILCHIGSGSSHFEKAVGLEEINSFVRQVSDGLSLKEQISWFEAAFLKVSEAAPGCSADFIAKLSTRENPEFTQVKASKFDIKQGGAPN